MLKTATGIAEIPDPRFLSVKAGVYGRSKTFEPIIVTELELEPISKVNHPDYFYDNSIHSDQMNENGETSFLTIKNSDKVLLRDSVDSSAVNSLQVLFFKC